MPGNNSTDTTPPVLIRNPKSGSSLSVTAGESVQIELNFKSDVPETASYYSEVAGLESSDWAKGTGEANRISVAASGTVNLLVTISPSDDAEPGDYPIKIVALCEGDPVNGAGLPLILSVAPGAVIVSPPIESEPIVEVAPDPEPQPPISPYRKKTPAVQTAPVQAPPPVEEALPPKAPRPTVKPRKETVAPTVVDVSPIVEPPVTIPIKPLVAPTPQPIPTAEIVTPPVVPTPAPPVETKFEQPIRNVAEPIRPVEPKPQAPVRNVAEPIRPVAPKVEKIVPKEPEIESIVIDLEPEIAVTSKPDQASGEDDRPDENFLDDPVEGSVVTLRPGESILLRFGFINNEKRRITYILEEDRSNPDECLPADWTTLVRGQVNVGENDRRYLAIRVATPVSAEPGEKRFVLLLGPDTEYLTPRTLTLSVRAAPAVKISAAQPKLSVGPFGRRVDFKLKVESAGNSQTAFRIAVKNPETVDSTAPDDSAPTPDEDIYDLAPWHYLFDQEVANLKSPSSNKPPDPEQIRLRVERSGAWWFGFTESHKVKVGAVPVTDETNGGKTENIVNLTATRWRLWPMPYWTIIPVLLLLIVIASGKPTDLRVTNQVPGSDSEPFVLGTADSPGKVNVQLEWKGPSFPWIKLAQTSTNGSFTADTFLKNNKYTDPVSIDSNTYGTERTYSVGNNTTAHVEVLPAATTGSLSLQWRLPGGHNESVALTPGAAVGGANTVSASIPLPAGAKEFVIRANNSSSNQHIQVYVLHESDGVTVTEAQTADNNASTQYMDVNKDDSEEITIELSGSTSSPGQNELELVSSDADNQIIQLHF